MFRTFNLALLYLSLFESPVFSTEPDLFLDSLPDEIDPFWSSSSSLPPTSSSTDSILGDGSFENIFTDDDSSSLLVYCVDTSQQQLQSKKVRARRGDADTVCPQNGAPLPPVPLPQFPDLLNSIGGGGPDGERWKVQENGVGKLFPSNTAEFSCGLWTSKPQVYKKPVCGSGNYLDSVRVSRGFYSYVANSYLGKFFFFFPTPQFIFRLAFLVLLPSRTYHAGTQRLKNIFIFGFFFQFTKNPKRTFASNT